MSQVLLKCVKEGGKLRVKIISPGYNHDANCQFPRDIRVENREYLVPVTCIKFSSGLQGKFFYKINKKDVIIKQESLTIEKIYEDEANNECAICMSEEKAIVFAPCGHYCCCCVCAGKITSCPLCRVSILQRVERSQLG